LLNFKKTGSVLAKQHKLNNMNKSKVEVRANFSTFGYAELIMKAEEVLDLVKRDKDMFNQNGVNDDRIARFQKSIVILEKLPADLSMEARKIKATYLKNKAAEEMRSELRKIVFLAKMVYGNNTEKLRPFVGVEISRLSDFKLAFHIETMANDLRTNIADFAQLGITEDYCNELNKRQVDFKTMHLDIRKNVHARSNATEKRWLQAKLVYDEMQLMCECGKLIWEYKSDASFRDYQIRSQYEIYSRKTEETPTTNADSNNG